MTSKYTDAYLDENEQRGGDGCGITPQTYLHTVLKGRAKQWISRYCRIMEKDLSTRADVVRGQSKRGATAYYRIVLPLLLLTCLAWSVPAQDRVCFYSPSQVERLPIDPTPVPIWVNPAGTLRLVEARSYITQMRAIDQTEAAAAAVQYSIQRQGIDARALSFRSFVPDAPLLSVYAVGWRYLWSGHLPERSEMGWLLRRLIEAAPCQEGGRS